MNRVLLVEDTPSLAEEIVDILKMEGFEVLLAKNGKDALSQLNSWPADVVISDLFMPEIDGFELIEAIRKDAHLKNMPIIILSARTTSDVIEKVKQIGADLFIKKPCDSRQLVQAIKNVINNRTVK